MVRLLTALMMTMWATALAAAPWDVVQDETRIEVDVGYLGNTVTMRFDEVLGAVDFDANRPERARANIVVPVRNVETGLGLVNNFVKSKDYLNAREYPDIRFSLKKLVRTSDRTADIFGDMTLLGVTQPMLFKAKLFRYKPPERRRQVRGGLRPGRPGGPAAVRQQFRHAPGLGGTADPHSAAAAGKMTSTVPPASPVLFPVS